jgi:hypothetical protein
MACFTIDELKKSLEDNFTFDFCFSESDELLKSWTAGTYFLTPNLLQNHKEWCYKAHSEWSRGNKTIILIIPIKSSTKYFQNLVLSQADCKIIPHALIYPDLKKISRAMMIAIYRAKVIPPKEFLISFN